MKLDCQSIKFFINTDLSDTEKCNGRSCFYCLKFILGSHTAAKLPVALHGMPVLQHSYVRKVNRNLQGWVRFPTGGIAHEPLGMIR